jgi:hypothetical protein
MSNIATKEIIDTAFSEVLELYKDMSDTISPIKELASDFKDNYTLVAECYHQYSHWKDTEFLYDAYFYTDYARVKLRDIYHAKYNSRMEKYRFDGYTNIVTDFIIKQGTKIDDSYVRAAKIGDEIIIFIYNKRIEGTNANSVLHFIPKECVSKEPTKDAQPDTNYTDEPSGTTTTQPKEETNPQQNLSVMAEQLKRLEDKVDKILAILNGSTNNLCEEDNKNGD